MECNKTLFLFVIVNERRVFNMRIKRVVSYLVVVVMGVGLLLPGNIALAKEVAENVEAGVVQEIIVQSLIGTRQMAGLTISGKSAEVTAYASGQGDIKKISMIVKLQKSVDGKWKNVQTWEKTTDTLSLNFAKEYSLSSKGSYRVQAAVTYYLKDNTTETKTTNSATKTYA